MSDDDRDIDVESDEGNDSDSRQQGARQTPTGQYYSQGEFFQAEKRAHHNALERKRRDHIKDSFSSLRDAVPALHGEKASRAQILKKSADYIQFMRRKNNAHQQDIDDLKRQNVLLDAQIRTLEKARPIVAASFNSDLKESESDDSDTDTSTHPRRFKKLKVSTH
ncbi:hypothetical protein FQA39_LY08073 [Lamprigera yunnana]|nr:hypothetical protein FQA39_LY08073 [Lamprigera yunnana]